MPTFSKSMLFGHFHADIQMEQSWSVKCGWRNFSTCWINHVGCYLTFHKAKSFWAFLLHSLPLHCLCNLLCATFGIFLLLRGASRILPIHDRPLLEIPTVSAKNSVGFCQSFALWSCWIKFLQEPRWMNVSKNFFMNCVSDSIWSSNFFISLSFCYNRTELCSHKHHFH